MQGKRRIFPHGLSGCAVRSESLRSAFRRKNCARRVPSSISSLADSGLDPQALRWGTASETGSRDTGARGPRQTRE